jgi:hypothetical protein
MGMAERISGGAGRRSIAGIFCLAILLPCATAGEQLTGCETCHGDEKYFVQCRKIYQYYRDWLTSPHKEANLTCDDCHGGDPEATDKESAHQGILPVTDPRSGLYYRNQPDTCGECHKRQARQFKESDHYKGLEDHIGTPTCTTCHAAMNRRPYYRDMVEQTCRVCHYEDNEDDLPLVADRANEILHRLNISKGYMNWTRVYYQSKGWPADSKALVDSLRRDYDAIISHGHTFDLEKTEQASLELLTKLKAIYKLVAEEVEKEGG